MWVGLAPSSQSRTSVTVPGSPPPLRRRSSTTPARPAQQGEGGLEVGRGEVHAVQAVEREHAHPVGPPAHLADRAGPELDLGGILRRPARRVGVGDERAVRDELELEVP